MGQTGPKTPSATTHSLFTAYLCGICKPLQTPATLDRILVKRLGQRFESARRFFVFPANTVKVKSLDTNIEGFVSSRLYPKASSMLSAACLDERGRAESVA